MCVSINKKNGVLHVYKCIVLYISKTERVDLHSLHEQNRKSYLYVTHIPLLAYYTRKSLLTSSAWTEHTDLMLILCWSDIEWYKSDITQIRSINRVERVNTHYEKHRRTKHLFIFNGAFSFMSSFECGIVFTVFTVDSSPTRYTRTGIRLITIHTLCAVLTWVTTTFVPIYKRKDQIVIISCK